ncbi:hypothetical protein [Gimesia sp.]|uniref:hypothetical protein n=1 Tax=Gimesia sp. TaxID=2024833 RepID=UPI0032F03DE7
MTCVACSGARIVRLAREAQLRHFTIREVRIKVSLFRKVQAKFSGVVRRSLVAGA